MTINYSEKLHSLIPGGAHTYSRGDDQFPDNAPRILKRGKGARVWDPDGREYLDYGMALRAVTVGYDYKEISDAAIAEIHNGNNLPRPTMIEYQAAETITNLIPCAEMVKFAKNGSTVTTAGVKLARAYTGRKYVAICAENPFFSYDDWFIGSTDLKAGVPEEYQSLTLKFNFNRIETLEALFDKYPNQIAAVILEPATFLSPCVCGPAKETIHTCNCKEGRRGFLHKVQDLCRKNCTVFILDEMITGFRWHLNGAAAFYGVEPDLATFGKAMANGFAVGALVGKKEIMNIGGILKEGQERVFLISTTHGAEMCGLGAFVKTAEVCQRLDVVGHLWKYGERLIKGANAISASLGLRDHFCFEGYPCAPIFVAKDKTGAVSLPLRTLYMQEMVKHGVLLPWVGLSYSHGEAELSQTLEATEKSLKIFREALDKGLEGYLHSRVVKPVFRRYN